MVEQAPAPDQAPVFSQLDEVGHDATTPEDQQALAELRAEVEAERADTLGNVVAKQLVELPGGAVDTADNVAKAREQGQDVTEGPYQGGRRG
ncbi:MAG TPA: hypothetical protein VK694_01660 [Verrucomicrobiae bacterium]|nr:hypothetical protein [Verrucomicrobiae bacterium]